ncbi:hypothetical protein K439DRAFT_1653947 [Ramaria rubella]|nr:hypothetical protein K439DRAFT_1653947 [Ramaria rubella]
MSPVPSDASIDTPAPPKERRFKLSRACDRCRRRRIKCDEGHPCQSCLSSHSPCTFEEPGKRTQHAKSKRTATLEDRMHHLETLIHSIPTTRRPRPRLPLPHALPRRCPAPALSLAALTNPAPHFPPPPSPPRPALAPSYMYFDEQGCKRWQGETSGLPLLDLLFDRAQGGRARTHGRPEWHPQPAPDSPAEQDDSASVSPAEWFPDRVASHADINPETLWKVITSCISPDLMDTLVQCYLSTSYYLMPFLHVPTFLADYGNPLKWGEPGFASFILAMCCLSSRHIDDPRPRTAPTTPPGTDAGTRWFDLFTRLRTLPPADRPTLYTIQAVLLAAIYAIGLGKLSKAFALLSEAVTLSFDAGLHRSTAQYAAFTPLEDEIRKRTFWAVYIWDKQAAAAFGRPPLLRLRDCDVGEPAVVDDEFVTAEGVGRQPEGRPPSCMEAFVATVRYYTVLEAVLDLPPSPQPSSPFLLRASALLAHTQPTHINPHSLSQHTLPAHALPPHTHASHPTLHAAHHLLTSLHHALPAHWAHTPATLASDDVIRVTQAVRLYCLERFVMLLIWRRRWGGVLGARGAEKDMLRACYACARELVAAHLHTATKGLMTYCTSSPLHPLIPPALDALRSCVELLRRFGGRYVCGLRNGELLEEFCRLSQIPLSLSTPSSPSSPSTHPHPTSHTAPHTHLHTTTTHPAPTRPPGYAPSKNANGTAPAPARPRPPHRARRGLRSRVRVWGGLGPSWWQRDQRQYKRQHDEPASLAFPLPLAHELARRFLGAAGAFEGGRVS